MIIVGLTGGIGSGKSTVAAWLGDLGATVVDADKVGHEVYLPGSPGLREVVEAFGEGILKETGEVDRQKLAKVVFSSPEALARLNSIVHPRILQVMKDRIEQARARGVKVFVAEAAILIEAGWAYLADEIWVVVAPEENVVQRLKQNKGVSEGDTRARIKAQLPTDERRRYARIVIENDGDLDALREKVRMQWEALRKRMGSDC